MVGTTTSYHLPVKPPVLAAVLSDRLAESLGSGTKEQGALGTHTWCAKNALKLPAPPEVWQSHLPSPFCSAAVLFLSFRLSFAFGAYNNTHKS